MNPLISGVPGSGKNFRVIYHEPICPECGSFDIDTDQVDTGDGLSETAHICGDCGMAWPLACVTDWTTPAPAPTEAPAPGPSSASQPATRR